MGDVGFGGLPRFLAGCGTGSACASASSLRGRPTRRFTFSGPFSLTFSSFLSSFTGEGAFLGVEADRVPYGVGDEGLLATLGFFVEDLVAPAIFGFVFVSEGSQEGQNHLCDVGTASSGGSRQKV
jgi:hypothetical protein